MTTDRALALLWSIEHSVRRDACYALRDACYADEAPDARLIADALLTIAEG